MKETLVFQGPCFTRSGYGDHSRDLLKSLRKMDRYDIKIIPMRWGNTPQNQADPSDEFGKWMLDRVVSGLNTQPDIFIQVSVANEFTPVGKFNIGVTAAVETTLIPKDFIDGSNKMDLILVPSEFTKGIMKNTIYQEQNSQTKQIIREHRITKPIEVLFEGVDLDVFLNINNGKVDILKDIETDFNFLYVGHWLRGDLGEDRKNVGMLIKTFASVFRTLPKKSQPGLILKTSQSGFSIMDREDIKSKIESVVSTFGEDCPPIYLIHGDLSESDMANLYHNPKVKAMVSFTKGEGYGRPLAEFTVTGKPILASNWSGHLDFLPKEYSVLLAGSLTDVHPSAADKFLLKEGKWFSVNYTDAALKLYDVYNNYNSHLEKSKNLVNNTVSKFSLNKMNEVFDELLQKYIKAKPKLVPINLPKLNKI